MPNYHTSRLVCLDNFISLVLGNSYFEWFKDSKNKRWKPFYNPYSVFDQYV